MYQKKRPSTTRLPRTILEEIQGHSAGGDDSHIQSHALKKSRKRGPSRKEARKQERVGLKQKKARFFSAEKKRRAEDEPQEAPQRKKARIAGAATVGKLRTGWTYASVAGENKEITGKGKAEGRTPIGGKEREKVVQLPLRSRIEEQEDAHIAYLERKLGYVSGGKPKRSALDEDGLDELLDWADSLQLDAMKGAGQESDGNTDDASEIVSEGSDEESMEEESKETDGGDSEEEWRGIDFSGGGEFTDGGESIRRGESQEDLSSQVVKQSPPALAARYLPPHLREKQRDQDSETIVKLKKQLKGLLNRMSEQNLGSIIDGVEGLYRDNRRHDVTTSITNLVIEGISSHSVLLDSYVILHAALISSLHKIIGVEFAAHFVQTVVADYEGHYEVLKSIERGTSFGTEENQQEQKGKECSNLMVLLSELYNFQVISPVLVFDLVRQLLQDDLTEFNVELLLKLMRNSGQQLRHDDPSALKDIIDIVQRKIAGKDQMLSSRTRFMIETLVNLKNNKLKRNIAQNQGAEAVERMKKFLTNLSKRKHVLGHDALQVSLEDLHSAESKGKWWLVGAAWGGNPLVEAQDHITSVLVNGRTAPSSGPGDDLLKLARKQGMNTDIRRSIFVVLMSGDDYVDACERLSQLGLTEVQQREIVRVLLHCCGNEKAYNPYYALVCQHLCHQSHSYKITLQFCLWDFLRDLGETMVGGEEMIKNARESEASLKISKSRLRNVARAYAWWVAKDVVNINILKAVDFTTLKPWGQEFLQELILQVFISSQTAAPLIEASQLPTARNRAAIEEIFSKATRIRSLAMDVGFVTWAKELALEALRLE